MSEEPLVQIETYSEEPKWLEISWKYADLGKATTNLHAAIKRYQDALQELDAAGTDIMNGKERIYLLKEAISQMENQK